MPGRQPARVDRYRIHLSATADWLMRTEHMWGGSSAYFSPLVGWSRAYPETTGYQIPTLLRLAEGGRRDAEELALRYGHWLLSIQNGNGSWNRGLHPSRQPRASVFNTAQVLKGLLALWRWSGEATWLRGARRAGEWLNSGLSPSGLWLGRDYRGPGTPSYYTSALWPMIDLAGAMGDDAGLQAGRTALLRIAERVQTNGAIADWGFGGGARAFTHTIAYTIRGFQECARLLGEPGLAGVVEPTLKRLVWESEQRNGRLPGSFDQQWAPDVDYVCLTGNVQVARSILLHEAGRSNTQLVEAAARMVDVVCDAQSLDSGWIAPRGAVPGSWPLSGAYMRLRYPNWAAKYLADALAALIARMEIADQTGVRQAV